MRLQRRRTPAVLLALVVVAGLTAVLTACSGAADNPGGKDLTPAQQLAAAKVKADAATSIHLTLRSSGIPASASGVLGADGTGTHAPAFKGTLDARISGIGVKVEVVAIDKLLYLKLPFTTEFTEADPKQYNAPDPAQLFAKEGGITSLMTATTGAIEGKSTRSGSDVLTTITGTLPGASVVELLNIGDATKTFAVTYGITKTGGELRTVTVVGPFYAAETSTAATSTAATSTAATSTAATSTAATSTYVLTLDKYGEPVEISKP